jgi:hypothetical protein
VEANEKGSWLVEGFVKKKEEGFWLLEERERGFLLVEARESFLACGGERERCPSKFGGKESGFSKSGSCGW